MTTTTSSPLSSSETSEFAIASAALVKAELALVHQREAVAALRRDLPPGPIADDYMFATPNGSVTLQELVTDRPMVIYHFMFGGSMSQPCPMCSMWADGWNAVTDHLNQNIDFALATNATVEENVQLAEDHGWQNLRWLSAAANSFKAEYGSVDADGNQWPVVTVFERSGDDVRLSYRGAASFDSEQGRGVDLLSPVWHLLDLTRAGRGDYFPSLDYHPPVNACDT